jgi:histidyl-tRNA synthetase
MKIEPKVLKGFRDFLPEAARKRQFVIDTLKQVFALYGFEPLETPALEYEEILTGKYGEEGEKLMYRFEDHGKRRVAMRYDQTVPLARVIAQYQNEITLPFKRYQVQSVWRADNTQRGRFREFLQCDIDTVGTNSPASDAEILQTVEKAYETLGFKNFTILVNDRKNFEGVDPKAIAVIDKLKKIGADGVEKELKEKGFEPTLLQDIQDKPETENLKQILAFAASKRIQYEPTLARGLDYYTGLIIEVEIDGYSVGSVGGGGRYDTLIGMFAGRDIPAVGFAFGFDRTIEAMEELNLFPPELTATQVMVTVFSPELQQKSLEVGALLRENNINTELYLDETVKMDKQLKYADKKKIPYVVIIGPDEAKQNKVVLKNMKTGEQKTIQQENLSTELS